MGKGKRLRSQRKAKNYYITMGRGELKAYLFNIINHLDDESYKGFCEIMLTACGVIDAEGNLAKEYENSPYWSLENGILKSKIQNIDKEMRAKSDS